MCAAFIPALPPSALMGGMIAPSSRLVNRFSRKKLVRTCGRRERPPALCAIFSWSPLARCCCARAAAVRAAARAVRIMGLVAARLLLLRTCGRRKGGRPRCARYSLGRRSLAGGSHPHPSLAVAWAAFAANAGGASVASDRREQETRLAAPRSCPRRATLLRTARQKPRRARPLPPRQARPRAHRSRRGCAPAPVTLRASVSSALPAQETRHVPPPRSLRRSNRPHQPSEVWRAAALQVKSYRPAPPGGRGVCAPRRKHSLHVSPAAPKAQGKRAPPGGKDRQRRAFPTPAVRRGFSDAPIAVCRSSPRCPR